MSESDVKLAELSNQITQQQKMALDELAFIKKAQSEVWNFRLLIFLDWLLLFLGTVGSIWHSGEKHKLLQPGMFSEDHGYENICWNQMQNINKSDEVISTREEFRNQLR